MGGERNGSKGGRYVGGFLQLFDWNAKSRKKLFSIRPDFPEYPKQGNQNEGNFPTKRIFMVDDDEIGAATSIKESSEYSCASSVTDEEGYGNRAPGVVARLMGLDSLPTSSSALETYSSPFSDTQSLPEVPLKREDLHSLYQENQMVRSKRFLDKSEGILRNTVPKHQKLSNRPIEKFQSEMVPSKSAKSVSITHHKLLSPIKNPGFVRSKDLDHIMETAAKIIDPRPQATARAKINSAGPPSVPLKVRELKDKMEASQRPSRFAGVSHGMLEPNAAKCLRGNSLNKSWNGPVGSSSKASCSSATDGDTACAKNKGKSISLAIQAKVNVQRREGLNHSQKNMEGFKEESDFRHTQSSKSESSSGHKVAHKKSSARSASTLLRQNNHKLNCVSAKGTLPSKPLTSSSESLSSNLHCRNVVSRNSSYGCQKNPFQEEGNYRVGSKKSRLDKRDDHKDIANNGARNVPRKKRSFNCNLQDERIDSAADTMLSGKRDKLSKSHLIADRHFPWAEEGRKEGSDVISFTFTTPMTRPMSSLELSKQPVDRNNLSADNRNKKKAMLCPDSLKISSLGYDVGVNSLSVLLEQKLRELTNGIESSRSKLIKSEASSASASAGQSAIDYYAESDTESNNEKHSISSELQMECKHAQMFSSSTSKFPRRTYDHQSRETEECCSSTTLETRQLYNFRLPSPVSILDPSSLNESCNSSDSTASNITEECKQQCSSAQGEETHSSSYLGTEKDLSDSANSVSYATILSKGDACCKGRILSTSTEWEPDYIYEILCSVDLLLFKDCTSFEIISPHLFNQIERKRESLSYCGDEILLERKALFDSVGECLEWRCKLYFSGGCKAYAKGVAMVARKERLAEEMYKEIQGWRRMRDNMVDELLYKDMSVQQGCWLDFESDESELTVEMEALVFDSLVDEVVDILHFSRWSSSARHTTS